MHLGVEVGYSVVGLTLYISRARASLALSIVSTLMLSVNSDETRSDINQRTVPITQN